MCLICQYEDQYEQQIRMHYSINKVRFLFYCTNHLIIIDMYDFSYMHIVLSTSFGNVTNTLKSSMES